MTQVTKHRVISKGLCILGLAIAITTGCGIWHTDPQVVAKVMTPKQVNGQLASVFKVPATVPAKPVIPIIVKGDNMLTEHQVDSIRRTLLLASTGGDIMTQAKLDTINSKLDKLIVSRGIHSAFVDSMFRRLSRNDDSIISHQRVMLTSLRKDNAVQKQIINRTIYQDSKERSVLEIIASIVILISTVILMRNIYLTKPDKRAVAA